MKRDPVLAQLDFLINGPSPKAPRTEDAEEAPPPSLPPPPPAPAPPLLPPLHTPLPAPDPVLSQLDALINGAPAAHAADRVKEPEEPRGPPGILREYGGVRGWMAMRSGQQQDDVHSTSPKRSTPPGLVAVCTNSPSLDHTTLVGNR